MIGIEETGRRARVTELPDDKISADYQVANDLPLDSEVHVGCRSAGQVSSVNLTLLVRLDVSDRECVSWIDLIRAEFFGLDRTRAEATLERGQGQVRQYQQTGRSLPAQPIHRGRAVIRYAKIHGTKHRPWLTALLARRPTKIAAIALANKIARMVWAMMAKGERYKEPIALAA